MENSIESLATEHKKHEVKAGKYEFLIQGVIREKDGYPLKTQKGTTYTKLRIILMNEENNASVYSSVYKAIFSDKDLKEVVIGIGNPALTHVYNSDPEKFEQENLIGETGFLFLGKRNGYDNIECFIKPKAYEIAVKQVSKEASESFKQELKEADGVPF